MSCFSVPVLFASSDGLYLRMVDTQVKLFWEKRQNFGGKSQSVKKCQVISRFFYAIRNLIRRLGFQDSNKPIKTLELTLVKVKFWSYFWSSQTFSRVVGSFAEIGYGHKPFKMPPMQKVLKPALNPCLRH